MSTYTSATASASPSPSLDYVMTLVLTWVDPEASCVGKGGYLFSIRSLAQDLGVTTCMVGNTASSNPWIGDSTTDDVVDTQLDGTMCPGEGGPRPKEPPTRKCA